MNDLLEKQLASMISSLSAMAVTEESVDDVSQSYFDQFTSSLIKILVTDTYA